jgi:hypothetical protein
MTARGLQLVDPLCKDVEGGEHLLKFRDGGGGVTVTRHFPKDGGGEGDSEPGRSRKSI